MIGKVHPWLSMWVQPRRTVRTLLQTRPSYGLFWLMAVYVMQRTFFFANYWSVGLSYSLPTILLVTILLSPLLGWVWFYIAGWILHCTGHWLKGRASATTLRMVYAWSKIPATLSLLMWGFLICFYTNDVFIADVPGPPPSLIHFVSTILSVFSFVLLVQSIREVQRFSFFRSFVNALLAWLLSIVFFILVASFALYIKII